MHQNYSDEEQDSDEQLLGQDVGVKRHNQDVYVCIYVEMSLCLVPSRQNTRIILQCLDSPLTIAWSVGHLSFIIYSSMKNNSYCMRDI